MQSASSSPSESSENAPPSLLRGLTASVTGARGLVAISFTTLLASARGVLTRESSDRRIRWWVNDAVKGLRLDVRVSGHEHYDQPSKTFIVMSNHQSHYDIPILFHAVGPDLRMVTKAELFRIPIWGPAMKRAGFIEIDRVDRKRAIAGLNIARQKLIEGIRIWIAPEGTRSRTGELLPFKKGGFVLARHAGVPILPVGIAGTRDVLPADAFLTAPGRRIGVAIGAPISPEGKTRDALTKETQAAIAQLMAQAEALRS